ACSSAFLATAAIQPWSAAGAENPMVTCLPALSLSPASVPAWGFPPPETPSSVLLVQAAARPPAARAAPPSRRCGRLGRGPCCRGLCSRMRCSWLRGWGVKAGSGGRAEPTALQQHGADDDRPLGDQLVAGLQAVQDEQVGDEREDQHAEDRP